MKSDPSFATLTPPPFHRERMPSRPWGATTLQWVQAARLAGHDVLPTVDDPTAPRAEGSLTVPGSKAPCVIPADRGVTFGFKKPMRYCSDAAQIREWAKEVRHGIGIMCRNVRVIDVDFKPKDYVIERDEHGNETKRMIPDFDYVGHHKLVQETMAELTRVLPALAFMPRRWRPSKLQMDALAERGWSPTTEAGAEMKVPPFDEYPEVLDLPDSGSYALVYRFSDDEDVKDEKTGATIRKNPWGKRQKKTSAGLIEFNGDDNYQILASRHESKLPQLWRYSEQDEEGTWYDTDCLDLPTWEQLPVLTRDDILRLCDFITERWPDPFNEDKEVAARTDLPVSDKSPEEDPVVAFLGATGNDPKFTRLPDGRYSCTCPNYEQHTSKSGTTTTIYIPEGWGGRVRGFHCSHAHCDGSKFSKITVKDYLDFIGYAKAELLDEFKKDLMTPEERALADARIHPDYPEAGPVPVLEMIETKAGLKLKLVQSNVNKILMHPGLCNIVFSFDQFTGREYYSINRRPPERFRKATTNEIYHYLTTEIGVLPAECSLAMVESAIGLAIDTFRHSSAEQELRKLKHDGKRRLDTWLSTALGVANTDYVRTLGVYMLTSIVGRIMQPGYKCDITPILYGPQGVRKSTFVQKLALKDDWYAESDISTPDKELMAQLLGKAVVELAELQGFMSREAAGIKAWLTRKSDNYRLAYDKFPIDRPRQCLCIGTTNDYVFLNAKLGIRRFAPLEISKTIDTEWMEANMEQLYAEAILRFNAEGTPFLELERMAAPHCREVYMKDSWEEAIEAWLPSRLGDGPLTVAAVMTMALGIKPINQTSMATMRACTALREIGARRLPDGRWVLPKVGEAASDAFTTSSSSHIDPLS